MSTELASAGLITITLGIKWDIYWRETNTAKCFNHFRVETCDNLEQLTQWCKVARATAASLTSHSHEPPSYVSDWDYEATCGYESLASNSPAAVPVKQQATPSLPMPSSKRSRAESHAAVTPSSSLLVPMLYLLQLPLPCHVCTAYAAIHVDCICFVVVSHAGVRTELRVTDSPENRRHHSPHVSN